MGVRPALLMLLVCHAVAMAAPAEVFVATGDRSPAGLPFSRFSEAALDDRARVVFVGASAAIFRRAGTRVAHVVGANDTLDGRTVAGVGPPALAADGCVAFRADFVGGGSAIYRRCAAGTDLLARVGRLGPDGPALLGFGQAIVIGSAGRVAFSALLDGGSTALFVADAPGALTEVARTGAPAPAGGTFAAFRLVGVSASGRVGFRSAVTAGPDGLFVWDGGAVRPLAVVGDASPVGGRFTALGLASVNDADQWAFRGTVARAGTAGTLNGVFTADATTSVARFTAVALEDDASPLGGRFRNIPTSLVPAINARGTVAFRASVRDGTASAGVFVRSLDGALATIVAVGDVVADGDDRAEGARLVRLRDPAIADDGSVLLRASISRGAPGLFVARHGRVTSLAILTDTTDLGVGFRFTDASVRATADDGVFLGLQEGVYVAVARGEVQPLALLGDPTPIDGTYAGFETPAAGVGGRIVFGASVAGGRANEALFTLGRRGPALLLMAGARVPGGGEVEDLFADPLDGLNRSGVGANGVAFHAALDGTGATTGLFVHSGHRLKAVARAGERSPAGGRYTSFGTPAVTGRRVAFVATYAGGSGGAAVFLRTGNQTRVVAAVGRETRTRLGGRFTSFDSPAAGADGVAFRATLDQEGLEGVFLAGGRRLIALVGSGDPRTDGARWRSFGPPTFAGRAVVFRADAVGGVGAGLYQVAIGRGGATPEVAPPAVEQLTIVGEPTPIGGSFLAFGVPTGSRRRLIAFTADLVGAEAASAVLLQSTTP